MTPEQVALLDDVVKTQRIRLLDVLVLGPLMVWGGARLRPEHPLAGGALVFFGITTMAYNARNYAKVRDALGAARA